MEYEGKQRLLGNILGFKNEAAALDFSEETLILQTARRLVSLSPLSSSIHAVCHHGGSFFFIK